MFTVNLREAFRSVSIGQSLFRKIYDRTRLPLVPIYGGFPVKLKTIVGKPIEYDPNLTPEQLAEKVSTLRIVVQDCCRQLLTIYPAPVRLQTARVLEDMISANQRIPGSIFRALLDRVYWRPKKMI